VLVPLQCGRVTVVKVLVEKVFTGEYLAADVALPLVDVQFSLVVFLEVVDVVEWREGTLVGYGQAERLVDGQKLAGKVFAYEFAVAS